MGLGVAALNTNQFRPLAGVPPFPAASANNGLSVDPVTGKIVLGNDTGGSSAKLLSNREIDIDTFVLTLLSTAFLPGSDPQIRISPASITLSENTIPFNNVSLGADTSGGKIGASAAGTVDPPQIFLDNGLAPVGSTGSISVDPAGNFQVQQNFSDVLLSVNRLTGLYEIGNIIGVGNGTKLSIDDTGNKFVLGNTANNAALSMNGVNGFTGTVTPVISITVNNGIVTNVT